jgi:YVTN family beta-propeller protein
MLRNRISIKDGVKMSKRMTTGVAIFAFLLTAAFGANIQAQPSPSYRITKTVPLGAPDRWDYIVFDPVLNRVYVSHGEKVTVVDGAGGAILGEVDGIAGTTHGIASVHSLGKGYIDDGKAGIAVSFDLKTLEVLKRIKAEPDADGIVYDHPSGHVLVIDGDSGKVTVIDPKTDDVVATIDGGGGLEFGVSGENGKFYVDGAEKNEIVRIDTTTNKADAHWPMPGCVTPHGLAIDRTHMRLFASCANKVMSVVNAQTGAVIANLPIGEGTDFAEFDPTHGLAFSSNRDGTLSIIAEKSPISFVALPAVTTEIGARTMAIDPKTGRIYLVTAEMTLNKSTAPADSHHRYNVKPGSVKLLFLDPNPN